MGLLEEISALRVVNDNTFARRKVFSKNRPKNPIEYSVDILNYLGNEIFVKDKLEELFTNLLTNITGEINKQIKDYFIKTYLCDSNFLLNGNISIPITEIDLFDELSLPYSDFIRRNGGALNEAIWRTINLAQSQTINGLTLNFVPQANLGGVNHANVLNVNISDPISFNVLQNLTIVNFSSNQLYENMINVNFNNLEKKKKNFLFYVEKVRDEPYIGVALSFLQKTAKQKLQDLNVKKGKDYGEQNDVYSPLLLLNDNPVNAFNNLYASVDSTKYNSATHVVKQLFKSLESAIYMNMFDVQLMLLYKMFDVSNGGGFTVDREALIKENLSFFKSMISDVVQRTISKYLLEIIRRELSDLILTNKVNNIKEKNEFYLLQYKSLLKLI
jgi:hypothetical protein